MASRGTAWRRTAVSSTGRAGLFPCPDLSTFGEASARPIGARTIVSCMDPTPVGMPIPILRRSALRAVGLGQMPRARECTLGVDARGRKKNSGGVLPRHVSRLGSARRIGKLELIGQDGQSFVQVARGMVQGA